MNSVVDLQERIRQLTDAATAYGRKLQEREAELLQARIEIATVVPENERLRAERGVFQQRALDLENHNQLLTESATEMARRLQDQDAELVQARIEIATVAPENERLRAEHAVFRQRALDLEDHNRLLTESATEMARRLQHQDAELMQARIKQNETENELRRMQEAARHVQGPHQIPKPHTLVHGGMRDVEPRFKNIAEMCMPYTESSVESLYALYKSVEYIVAAKIPGDLVISGVGRGGDCVLVAATLLAFHDDTRRIFMFDTFEVVSHRDSANDSDPDSPKCVSVAELQLRLCRAGYPLDKLVFVKGFVEETAGLEHPVKDVALLHLNIDLYRSTLRMLESFYPCLADGGVLVLDDYGHCAGQHDAATAYFKAIREPALFNRIDYGCRVSVKRRTDRRLADQAL